MVELKTIAAYSSIPLAIAIVVAIFYGIQPEPNYFCDSTQKKAFCFSVDATKCFQNPDTKKSGYKICPEGWKVIPIISEEQTVILAKQYLCSVSSCTEIKR